MFFFLSKLLPLFVYPLGLALVLLLVAYRARYHQYELMRLALLTAILLLFLAGNKWVSLGLARSLESQYPPLTTLPQADVIVVLGGGTQPQSPPRTLTELNEAGDRLIYATWLYQQGVADHLLLSGGGFDRVDVEMEAVGMASLLTMFGIPESALWLDTESRNTYENALYSAEILEAEGIEEIVLVTSAFHMPRSVAIFERQGFTVIPAPADFRATESEWAQWRDGTWQIRLISLLPQASYLEDTTTIVKEYIGLVIYRLRGWA